ncbi:MAG: GspH/FimT family pseudopilin [Deltaproteobacteria bacterium]|nr:GspH/FimT family pseudopilin [Deltaproteobacteria bacterium]
MRLAPGHRGGFTLIEMMAVVTIFALLAAFVAPQVGSVGGRNLRRRAEDIGAQIQLARERSVLTGAPHRLLLDLESGGYRLEWWVSDDRASGDEPAEEEEPSTPWSASAPIPMAAPRQAERSWQPLRGRHGSFVWIEEGVRIAAVATAGDRIETGDVGIAFDSDGTTSPAEILLDDENERRLWLKVLPLADGVRIEDEE